MINVIRREFNGTDAWLSRISKERQQKLRDQIEQAQVGDGLVDALYFTQFADKAVIIRKPRG